MLCEDGNDSKLAWPDSSAKIESDWYVEIEIPQYANAPKTRAPNKDPSVCKKLQQRFYHRTGAESYYRRWENFKNILTNFLQGHL
jgi:hypothetical protein